jgi:hypothetical protein
MSEAPTVSDEQYGRNLAAMSYPALENVPGVSNAFRRRWVLRLNVNLPERAALESLVESFETDVRQKVATALGVSGELGQPVPRVSVVRLDEHHLVLAIDSPTSEAKMGDAAAITTFGILRAADEYWKLEDLQGIPKRYWPSMIFVK